MTDTNRNLSLALVALAHADKQIKPAMGRLREQGKTALMPRENVAAISPIDGTVLGHIVRTNPEAVAKVVDQAAVMAHIHDTNPDGLEDVTYVVNDPGVVEVLREHAPHLLESEVRIRPYALNEVLKAALAAHQAGKPLPPGVQVDQPVGTVNVYPGKDDTAVAAIEAVIRSGAVSLEGAVIPLSIEEGTHGAEDA